MKANASEKLYYAPYGDIREDNPITDNDIEYVRNDAFIEKATMWLAANALSYFYHDPVKDDYGFEFTDMIGDMKEALDRTDV